MRSRISIALLASVLAVAACGPGGSDDAAYRPGVDGPGTVTSGTLGFELETTISLPSSITIDLATSSTDSSSGSVSITTAPPITTGTTTTTAPRPTSTSLRPTLPPPLPTACSAGKPPIGEVGHQVGIDVDGDGVDETVYASKFGLVWMIVVEFAGNRYTSMPVVEAETFDGVRVVGGAPFRGGASEDIVFSMTGGAYSTLIGFARTDGCGIERLSNENGSPIMFLSGASVANFSGVHCSVGLVQQYTFELAGEDANGNPFFEGGFTPYNLNGYAFTEFPSDGAVISLEELQAIGTFECFGLSL